MAKGAVPDDHPLVLGMTGFWGLELANAYAREADVVLALGTRFAETDASSWHPDYTWRFPPSRLIQVDIDPAEIGRSYPVEIGAVADTALAVAAIAEGGQPGPFGACIAGETCGSRSVRRGPAPSRPPGSRAAATPSRSARSGSWPTCGTRCRPTRCWSPTWAGTRTASPSATNCPPRAGSSRRAGPPPWASGRPPRWASQIHDPERTVVALVGDGGMSAQWPALPMAVEQGLPVIFVVMNNRAHGTIADLETASFGSGYGCEFRDPGRPPVQPGLRRAGAGVRRRRLPDRRSGRSPDGAAVLATANGGARPCSTCR